MTLFELSDFNHYLHLDINNQVINQTIQTLYEKKCVSYPRTKDKRINPNDLSMLLQLLKIESTPVKPSYMDHSSLFGPIRPTAFPYNLKKHYSFSKLELFLHELITDSTLAWLMNKQLADLRNQDDDINQFKQLTTNEEKPPYGGFFYV